MSSEAPVGLEAFERVDELLVTQNEFNQTGSIDRIKALEITDALIEARVDAGGLIIDSTDLADNEKAAYLAVLEASTGEREQRATTVLTQLKLVDAAIVGGAKIFIGESSRGSIMIAEAAEAGLLFDFDNGYTGRRNYSHPRGARMPIATTKALVTGALIARNGSEPNIQVYLDPVHLKLGEVSSDCLIGSQLTEGFTFVFGEAQYEKFRDNQPDWAGAEELYLASKLGNVDLGLANPLSEKQKDALGIDVSSAIDAQSRNDTVSGNVTNVTFDKAPDKFLRLNNVRPEILSRIFDTADLRIDHIFDVVAEDQAAELEKIYDGAISNATWIGLQVAGVRLGRLKTQILAAV